MLRVLVVQSGGAGPAGAGRADGRLFGGVRHGPGAARQPTGLRLLRHDRKGTRR